VSLGDDQLLRVGWEKLSVVGKEGAILVRQAGDDAKWWKFGAVE
jgi:hypothetical protein